MLLHLFVFVWSCLFFHRLYSVVVIDTLKRVAYYCSSERFHYIKFLGILFRILKDWLLYGRQ